ncbi:hypothetical protein F2Q69_00043939 [Brassica cretica]|uniref:Uncharacterized protein n=1 Tax=Brassica cretica TaxID=69181 RepID=A0A8S9N5T0_BRACR|nr:hypothetical protein F2Q69_00043939 [Brassica cretica]
MYQSLSSSSILAYFYEGTKVSYVRIHKGIVKGRCWTSRGLQVHIQVSTSLTDGSCCPLLPESLALFLSPHANQKLERSTRREPGSGFAKLKGCMEDAASRKLLGLRMLREEANLKNLSKKGKLEVLSTSLFFVLQCPFQLLETRAWEKNLHQPPPLIVYFLFQWNTKTPNLV